MRGGLFLSVTGGRSVPTAGRRLRIRLLHLRVLRLLLVIVFLLLAGELHLRQPFKYLQQP